MPRLNLLGTLSLLLVACLTIMVGCVIVPGLPSIAQALGVPAGASWLVTVPSLGVVVSGPFVGTLTSRIGAKNALLIGLGLYGALGYGCVWLEGYPAVFIDRFLLGGATAIVMTGGTTLISEFFDGDARMGMIAKQGMAIELGGVVFLAVGGVLATLGWAWPFILYFTAWLLCALVAYAIPGMATKKEEARIAHGSTRTLSSLADVYGAASLSMICFFAAIIMLPGKLEAIGLDEAQTGYILAFVSLVAVFAAFCLPRVCGVLGDRYTLVAAFGSYALAHVLFSVTSSFPPVILGGILLGCGFGLSVPLVNNITIERTTAGDRGFALGYLSSAIFLGQFLSSFLEEVPLPGTARFLIAAAVALFSLVVFAVLATRVKAAVTR